MPTIELETERQTCLWSQTGYGSILFEISQRKIVEWLYENNIISEEQLPDLDDDISVKKWFAQYVHSDVISMFGEIDDSEKILRMFLRCSTLCPMPL